MGQVRVERQGKSGLREREEKEYGREDAGGEKGRGRRKGDK
jgi:hypothetical protein